MESLESYGTLAEIERELSQAEIELARRDLASDWREWLRTLFPAYVSDDYGNPIPFASHHDPFWEWTWSIEKGKRPSPFVAIWPRGGAKSTNAEMATVSLGARGVRRYGLYVCGTQDQADDHVQNIADMLEGASLGTYYPELAERMVGKFGNSKGWRRNRLRTSSGFTVDAIGLDSASRGAKLEDARPDFMVFDDLDDSADSEHVTEKKIRALTRKLIPAGSRDLAVLAVQNLVHPDSIFVRLTDDRAKFLSDRIVSGPIPALENVSYDEQTEEILSGEPTWEGMDLPRCREMAKDMGLLAFRVECQHDVEELTATVFEREWFDGPPTVSYGEEYERINQAIRGRNRYDASDQYLKNFVKYRWLSYDTAFKDKDSNDATGKVVFEMLPDYHILVRYAEEQRLTVPGIEAEIETDFVKWNYDNKLRGIIVEDKGSGIGILQTLQQANPKIAPYLIPFDPKQDSKEFRARQASVWVKRDCIWLPEPSMSAQWLPDFEDALFSFPFSRRKDVVDAFTQFILYSEPRIARGWRARSGFNLKRAS